MADYYPCPFGGTEIDATIDRSIPVQCPECGSVRLIRIQDIAPDYFKYPRHSQPDTLRQKRCYKRFDGIWKIAIWMPEEEAWRPEGD